MADEYVIQNDPQFEAEARRTMYEYEARRRRRGDDPGASAGVMAPVEPVPSERERGSAKLSPERDGPAA